jgi:hypothetical protein
MPYQTVNKGGQDGFFTGILLNSSGDVIIDAEDTAAQPSALALPFSVATLNCSGPASHVTPWDASCNYSPSPGSATVTLPATYNTSGTEATFSHWEDGTTALTRTLSIGKQNRVQAIAYYAVSYQLGVSVAGNGSATPASGSYLSDASAQNITATPASGSIFSGWSLVKGSAIIANPASASTTITLFGPASIQAKFTAKQSAAITWANPADITFGSALSGTQLNAKSSVPGTFLYNPGAGTVLKAGSNQALSVTFTPTDTPTYANSTATVHINVKSSVTGGAVVSATTSQSGGILTVNAKVANASSGAMSNLSVTGASFTATGTPASRTQAESPLRRTESDAPPPATTTFPVVVGTVPAGNVANVTLTLPGIASGTPGILRIAGAYTGGSFSFSQRTVAP